MSIRIHLLSVLFFMYFSLHGQDTRTNNFDSLLLQSKLIGLTDTDKAISLALLSLDEATKNNNLRQQAESNEQLVYIYLRTGDFDKTEKVLDHSMAIYEQLGDQKGKASVLAGYGEIALYEGRNFESSNYFHNALAIATKLDLTNDVVYYKRRIANILTQSNDFTTSIQILREAFDEAFALKDVTAQADILNGIGGNYHDLGKLDSSIITDRQAYVLMDSVDDAEGMAMVLTNLAYSQLDKGALQNGFDTLMLSKTILDTINSPSILINYEMLIAYYHYLHKDFDRAEALALQSLSKMREFNYALEEIWIEELLYKILKEKRNYKEALHYLEEVIELKDTLVYQEKSRQALDLFSKYQSAQKDAQLSKQQIEIERKTSQRNMAYSGGLGLLALGVFLFYRTKQKQKLNATKIDNLEKQQKLVALDYMVQGQEEERKRIAQDLHDGLGGLLSTAQMQLQNVQKEIQKLGELDLLNKAERMIDNACFEVRRISHDMMPGALIDLGLKDAVEDLTNKIRSEIGIDFIIDDRIEELLLTDIQKVQLYRTIQEILSNVVKHSEATEVTLIFSKTDSILKLSISDNGKGFDRQAVRSKEGIGLRNIESRISYLNGQVNIQSEPGNGVYYEIKIPIN